MIKMLLSESENYIICIGLGILCMHVYVYLTRTYASSARVCIRTRANARIFMIMIIHINAFTRGCFDTNVRKHDHIMMYVRVHVRACMHMHLI